MKRSVVPFYGKYSSALQNEIEELFTAIAHGDEDHRRWLHKKLYEHFGLPYPENEPDAIKPDRDRIPG
jgi:rubrerythrin